MKLKQAFLFLFLFDSLLGNSQTKVRIVPSFEGKPIALNTTYIAQDSSDYTISTLRFYVSHIRISSSDGEKEVKKIHLVDLEDASSVELFQSTDGIRSFDFLLGTDSLTNVSGILDGPLDPLLGMYWTWSSGYINFKMEGTSSRSPNPDKSFEYHIGGYLPPFSTARWVHLDLLSSDQDIQIELPLDKWLKGIDLNANPSVMIPGKEAAHLADQLVTIVKIGHEE